VTRRPLLCPSSSADAPEAAVIGVVLGSVDEPRVRTLEHPVPVSDEILDSTAPLPPTRVLRISAVCQQDECRHFSGDRCAFASKVVRLLPEVTGTLPACGIRGRCRWFAQEGAAACLRCPQVVTQDVNPSPAMASAADPLVPVPPDPAEVSRACYE
jgi:hypothetical protein